MNPTNMNCPCCAFRIEGTEECGFYKKSCNQVQSPNSCEMFTCSQRERLHRAWKFTKLMLIILGFIALVILELKISV